MTTLWMPGFYKYDLSKTRGNGPWPGGAAGRGLVLHVNVSEDGTDYHWFATTGPSNPNSVCPNYQIYKTATSGPGGVGSVQLLPFNWQSWCQADGNSWGPSVECAGMPGEAMTTYQLQQIAKIYKVGHDEYNWPYRITDTVTATGFGTHVMGGLAWGGHSCPGPGPRAGQRTTILGYAQGVSANPGLDILMTTPIPAANLEQIWDATVGADRIPTGSTTNPNWTLSTYAAETYKQAHDAKVAALAAVTQDELNTALAAINSKIDANQKAVLDAIAAISVPAPAPGASSFTFSGTADAAV